MLGPIEIILATDEKRELQRSARAGGLPLVCESCLEGGGAKAASEEAFQGQ